MNYCFLVEAYEDGYACPMFGLFGYKDVELLVKDCWKAYKSDKKK